MFGEQCYRHDEAVSTKKPWKGFPMSQLDYASELLVELLNRASTLEWCAWWAVGQIDAESPERVGALENLYEAVEVFVCDCNEARIRARRTRLVAGTRDGHLVTSGCDSLENDDVLAEIGGPLVSKEQAEKEQAESEDRRPGIDELVPAIPEHFTRKFEACRRFFDQLEAAGCIDGTLRMLKGALSDAETNLRVEVEDGSEAG